MCLFWTCWGMSVISTVTTQVSPFNFCIFSPFLWSLQTQIYVAYNSDLYAGVGDYWISTTFREEKVSISFSGRYSTVSITGKTTYGNRENQRKWTLAASPLWSDIKVNPGIHYKYTAFQDLIQLLQNKLVYIQLVKRRGFGSFQLR